MGNLFRLYAGFAAGLITVSVISNAAHAAPIFTQAPATITGGYASDRSYDSDGAQAADDVTVASSTTARSVTWRGFFAGGNTPATPLSFDLIFYGSIPGNVPNQNHIISSTTVSFTSAAQFTDTGSDMSPYDVYEFRANLTATPLSPSFPVWFSVLANTSNDGGDDFHWGVGAPANAGATRGNVSGNGAFSISGGNFHFILDNAVVPEPATLSVLALGAGALLLRRRRRA